MGLSIFAPRRSSATAIVPFVLLVFASTAFGAVIRVKPNADDANDGSTWALAKKTVQAGLNAATSGAASGRCATRYSPFAFALAFRLPALTPWLAKQQLRDSFRAVPLREQH